MTSFWCFRCINIHWSLFWCVLIWLSEKEKVEGRWAMRRGWSQAGDSVLIFRAEECSQKHNNNTAKVCCCGLLVQRSWEAFWSEHHTVLIALPAANQMGPCQDSWPAILQSFGVCQRWRKRLPVHHESFWIHINWGWSVAASVFRIANGTCFTLI